MGIHPQRCHGLCQRLHPMPTKQTSSIQTENPAPHLLSRINPVLPYRVRPHFPPPDVPTPMILSSSSWIVLQKRHASFPPFPLSRLQTSLHFSLTIGSVISASLRPSPATEELSSCHRSSKISMLHAEYQALLPQRTTLKQTDKPNESIRNSRFTSGSGSTL